MHAQLAVDIPLSQDMQARPQDECLYGDPSRGGSSLSARTARDGCLRLLFLDVDGVLNRQEFTGGEDAANFSQECMQCLGQVLEDTSASVVLSSTWRSSEDLRQAILAALEALVSGCVVGQTLQDPSYRNDLRPAEIAAFLSLPEVERAMRLPGSTWCAVDDMNLKKQAKALVGKRAHWLVQRMLPALERNFVRTDRCVGLDAGGAASIVMALIGPRVG
mmetsp:Transcript_46625/g.141491  ORF Transcript_46625/g.141491 Transcript_46625/m.141491 type:complete len:219 (-) Transcript_46625:65-721(-)